MQRERVPIAGGSDLPMGGALCLDHDLFGSIVANACPLEGRDVLRPTRAGLGVAYDGSLPGKFPFRDLGPDWTSEGFRPGDQAS